MTHDWCLGVRSPGPDAGLEHHHLAENNLQSANHCEGPVYFEYFKALNRVKPKQHICIL